MTLASLAAGENLDDGDYEQRRLSKHFLCGLRSHPTEDEQQECLEMEQTTLGRAMARLAMLTDSIDRLDSITTNNYNAKVCAMSNPTPVSWQQLEQASADDTLTTALKNLVTAGAPDDKSLWPIELAEYHRHRHLLTVLGPVVLYKDRTLIPTSLRKEVLDTLHSAHQGSTSMINRASAALF